MVVHELLISLLAAYASSEYLHGSRRRACYAALATIAANVLLLLPARFAPSLTLKGKLPIVGATYVATLYADTVGRTHLSRFQFVLALQEALMRQWNC